MGVTLTTALLQIELGDITLRRSLTGGSLTIVYVKRLKSLQVGIGEVRSEFVSTNTPW